jgi:hypothetical protein
MHDNKQEIVYKRLHADKDSYLLQADAAGDVERGDVPQAPRPFITQPGSQQLVLSPATFLLA